MIALEDRDGRVWLDGRLIPWRDARLHVLSYTVQHGAGVFEGVRAYESISGPAIFRLREHARRLLDSAKILQIPHTFSLDDICAAHISAVNANDLGRAYIRANVFYDGKVAGVSALGNGVHMSVAAWQWDAYIRTTGEGAGVRIKTSSYARLHINAALRKAKANGHYINSMLAVHEAKQQGFDDALMLDTQGYVAECSTSNIFIIRDGLISTPDRTAILEGVTRDSIVTLARDRGLEVDERRITRDDVYCADEVFITGTAAEVVPVVEVDNRGIGCRELGPITQMLRAAYMDAVHGRDSLHLDWLTPVAGSCAAA